jgi:hypothetical protein
MLSGNIIALSQKTENNKIDTYFLLKNLENDKSYLIDKYVNNYQINEKENELYYMKKGKKIFKLSFKK